MSVETPVPERDTAIPSEPKSLLKGRDPRPLFERIALHATLVFGAFVFALPFLWLVSTSLKWDREVFADPPNWFDRLRPRLPYHAVRTPYIAHRDARPFAKPDALDDAVWDVLRPRLESTLWDAAQPILFKRDIPDPLRNDLRRHITRDLWDRIVAEKPSRLWTEQLNRIQAELVASVTEQKVDSGWDLLYRSIRLGMPTIQTTDRLEYAIQEGKWATARGDVRLIDATDSDQPAREIWTDFRAISRPPYAAYFSYEFMSPTPTEAIRAITIPIRGDESYHHFTATVEIGGDTLMSEEPIVMETFAWQETTLQLSGKREPHERANVIMTKADEGSPVVAPNRVRLTLTLHRASYIVAVFRKFSRNYIEAASFVKFWRFVSNTIIVTALSIVAQLFSCSLVAYGFARLQWPGRDFLFMLLLSTMMLPSQVTMIPVFMIMRQLNFYDTLHPLWIGSLFGSAFFIFLLRQFLMGVPRDLEEAAKIDGCGFFGIYWRIMLPLVKPALAAIAIFQFMASWNDFLGPLIYVSSEEKMTLSLGLQLFQSMHGSEYGMLMAASTVMTLPVILIFFFAQRYFIQGVTLTGMKG